MTSKPEGVPDNVVFPPLPTTVSDDTFDFLAPVVDPIPDDNMEIENNSMARRSIVI